MKSLIIIVLGLFSISSYSQVSSKPDKWELKQGEINGLPLIIRKNTGYGEIKNELKDYKFRAGIAFRFQNTTSSGMPTSDEMKSLDVLDNKIFEIYEKSNKAFVTICLTTNGFREYVIYSNSEEWLNKCFKKLEKEDGHYVLTTYLELDASWLKYNEF